MNGQESATETLDRAEAQADSGKAGQVSYQVHSGIRFGIEHRCHIKCLMKIVLVCVSV